MSSGISIMGVLMLVGGLVLVAGIGVVLYSVFSNKKDR